MRVTYKKGKTGFLKILVQVVSSETYDTAQLLPATTTKNVTLNYVGNI